MGAGETSPAQATARGVTGPPQDRVRPCCPRMGRRWSASSSFVLARFVPCRLRALQLDPFRRGGQDGSYKEATQE